MRNQHLVVAAAAWGVCALALRAHADAPFTAQQVQLGAGLDYGLYLGEAADDIPTPYGLGINVRAGYTLEPRVYLGGELNYFFGASQDFPQYGDVEGSLSIVQYGAEAGYDIGLSQSSVLRPKLGVGAATVAAEVRVEGNRGDLSESGLAMLAGVQALHGWDSWFVMAEARYTYLTISTRQLRQIPGIDVEDDAELDGLLFCVGVGVAW